MKLTEIFYDRSMSELDRNEKYGKLSPYFEKGDLLFVVNESSTNEIHLAYLFGRVIKLSNFQADIDTNTSHTHYTYEPNQVKSIQLDQIVAAYTLPDSNILSQQQELTKKILQKNQCF